MRITDGSVSAEFQAVRLPLGAGLGGFVAQQGVPIDSADYFHDDRFRHTATIDSAVHAEGLVSILGVPLKRGAQVIGVLFAADRRRRAFSRDEVALLSSLAAHAAVALDNARLLAETRAALIGLEQANAALRDQSRDTERAVLAHDRLAELILRGGGVADVAAELAAVLGGAVDLQTPAQLAEPIGPGQSAVPVVAGSQVLGRLVLTREGDASAGGSAGAGTRRGGDRAAAAVQPAPGGGGQPRTARPAGGPAVRFGRRRGRDRRQGSGSGRRPERRSGDRGVRAAPAPGRCRAGGLVLRRPAARAVGPGRRVPGAAGPRQ